MSDRAISFSAPMVAAILEGWKTQTRRLVSPQPRNVDALTVDDCSFGGVGDLLWVPERWFLTGTESAPAITYAVGGSKALESPTPAVRQQWEKMRRLHGDSMLPSSFMPKWAARIRLRIVGVRIGRLQDITAEDAIAEGLRKLSKDDGRTWKYGLSDRDGLPGNDDVGWHWKNWNTDPRVAFSKVWDATAKIPWTANPYVYVIDFERL